MKPLFSLAALCLAITGCASKPEFYQSVYQYDSKVHSGTVQVTETTNVPQEQCDTDWREDRTFQPSGVRQLTGFKIEVQVLNQTPEKYGEVINLELPSEHGRDVVVKDFQKTVTMMVGIDSNGMVKQGNEFFFPSGFFLRASQPKLDDNNLSFCLGVDRTYVTDAEMQNPNPLIHMDRLNVRFDQESGVEKIYSFGSIAKTQVSVRAVPL
jgi:hypothetical protein